MVALELEDGSIFVAYYANNPKYTQRYYQKYIGNAQKVIPVNKIEAAIKVLRPEWTPVIDKKIRKQVTQEMRRTRPHAKLRNAIYRKPQRCDTLDL